MPLLLETPRSATVSPPSAWDVRDTGTIELALLNNLGDAGLEKGERQIVQLLTEAAGSRVVRLRLFSLPGIARGSRARVHLSAHYTDYEELMRSPVDGLIVTGCEPRANLLPDEPFWRDLTEVIDWAEHNTRSAVWSCLAAHAAALHLDGIHRQPFASKLSGVFPVDPVAAHPLTSGIRRPFLVPHSRYNDLAEDDLAACGYRVLTRSPQVGADLFVKQWRSLFVYLQGHPEYDAGALYREYRRDVLRFVDGLSSRYPSVPENYGGLEFKLALEAFEARVRKGRDRSAMAALPRQPVKHTLGRGFARRLFRNWISLLDRSVVGHAV